MWEKQYILSKDRFKNIQKAIENDCGYEQFNKRLQELAEDIRIEEQEIAKEESLVRFIDPEPVNEFLKHAKSILLSDEIVCETIINLLVNEVWVRKNKSMIISFKFTNKNGVSTIRNNFLSEPKFQAHQLTFNQRRLLWPLCLWHNDWHETLFC